MTLEELQDIVNEYMPPDPTPLDSTLVRNIVDDLRQVEVSGGYLAIAKNRGVLVEQVKLINRIRLARISQLTPEEIEIGELSGKK